MQKNNQTQDQTHRQVDTGLATPSKPMKKVSNDSIIICDCLVSNGQKFGFVLGGVRR